MSLPYFPLFVTDFEADTSHLTMTEDGAYNRLLRLCWMTPGCSIPNDEAWIFRRMRARDDAEKEAIRTVLSEFFRVENGRLFSPRLRREALLSEERHSRRVEAGRLGGRKSKSLETQETKPSNAKAKPKQPEPEPYKEKETTDVVSQKRASSLPQNWVPSDQNIRDAINRNFTEEEIRHEADRFRDYHLAKGTTFKNWDAGWRTWLGNAKRYAPRQPGRGSPHDALLDAFSRNAARHS